MGSHRKRLPAYASTYHGDREGGLDSIEAFGDFALQCREMGYRAFKIHGWHDGDAREEAALVLHVRKVVGDEMTLMLDPACELRSFADALYVGRACDEAGYFWLEDPYRDSGVSAFGHRRLREMLKTPLLQTEHVRGVEPKADFLIAGGTDFLRSDPEYDLGLTGAMKIHHVAEGLGVDVEVHACGPAHRHLMAISRNSNFYEVALVGPDCPNAVAPVYRCGYSDQLDCIDADGTVPVPDGVGLGVDYDWDFIERNRTAHLVYKQRDDGGAAGIRACRETGAADQTRTGPKSLEGSCATTTPQPRHRRTLCHLRRPRSSDFWPPVPCPVPRFATRSPVCELPFRRRHP